MSLLRAEGLTRRFGGIVAVNAISFELREGQMLSVIGPNGAGKTTLFNLISGHDRPDAGTVRFDGAVTTAWSPERLARHGLARTFQHGRVFANLSVRDNVLLGAHARLRVARPGLPLIGAMRELAAAMLRPAAVRAEEAAVNRGGGGDPGAVRRPAAAADRSAGLFAVLCQPPPGRDRAGAGAAAAAAAAGRADGGDERDRDGGDAGDHRRAEGARADDPADRAQARAGDAAVGLGDHHG